MIPQQMSDDLRAQVDSIREQGLYKEERILSSAQDRVITVGAKEVKNFCSNNYLGLSNNPIVIKAAADTMKRWGYGLSSVRFICGTQALHKHLEERVSSFLRMEDTILFSSCFDANGALFEPLLDERDGVFSDELNHASIIDGIRLSKAERFRYRHADVDELEKFLKEASHLRRKLIITDGVFSMDGDIAPLKEICDVADKYGALVVVDDSHATGYIGKSGRGTVELCNVEGRVDLITTTFGKALGGASGGCISGKKEIIELLRQRSRPYLFSNTLAPAIVGGVLKVLELIETENPYRSQTLANAASFREQMEREGFDLIASESAIIAVMLYDEKKAVAMSQALLGKGIYVIGFSYPVVPKGRARIRVQLTAAHTQEDIDEAVRAFVEVRSELFN